MSEFGGLQKHENIQHAPILGYEARHCCCWPAEGSPNFTACVVYVNRNVKVIEDGGLFAPTKGDKANENNHPRVRNLSKSTE